jgi:hypothetical protein
LVIIASLLVFIFIKEPKVYRDESAPVKPGLFESLQVILRDKNAAPCASCWRSSSGLSVTTPSKPFSRCMPSITSAHLKPMALACWGSFR